MDDKKEIPLKEKIDTIFEKLNEQPNFSSRKRKLRIPRRAKVRRTRIKKGWVGIIKIDENGNISGEKSKIEGGVFTLKDGTYHVTDGKEIRFWNGRFPVIFQPTWRINPIHFSKDVSDINQTYGFKYIQAKMLKDTIKTKGKGMTSILVIVLLLVGGYLLLKYVLKLF